MPHIKAVIFDSDGTLMDSLEVIVAAYAHVAGHFGYQPPSREGILEQLRWSYPLAQILQTFFPQTPVEQLMKVNNEFIKQQAGTTAAFAGVRELLQDLRSRGLLLAIVTGSSHKVHDLLRHHDLEDFFASIVHSERISFSKPDPAGFLLALDECGVRPGEAVMVGDSPNDILAGKRGGAAATIGIAHGHGTQADLQAADADYVVANISELQTLLIKLTN